MTNESNFDRGSMDGFAGQDDASDSVSGDEYEGMLDQGFTTPEREPNVDRFENEHETLDDRLAEEVPDTDPESAYGNPDGRPSADDEYDASRVGRLTAPDEGRSEDDEADMVAQDEGFAGGASSAEEASMHLEGGEAVDGFDVGFDGGVDQQ